MTHPHNKVTLCQIFGGNSDKSIQRLQYSVDSIPSCIATVIWRKKEATHYLVVALNFLALECFENIIFWLRKEEKFLSDTITLFYNYCNKNIVSDAM